MQRSLTISRNLIEICHPKHHTMLLVNEAYHIKILYEQKLCCIFQADIYSLSIAKKQEITR